MDFALTEEHRMVQRMVREFAQREVAPVIKEYDRAQEMAPFVLGLGAPFAFLRLPEGQQVEMKMGVTSSE